MQLSSMAGIQASVEINHVWLTGLVVDGLYLNLNHFMSVFLSLDQQCSISNLHHHFTLNHFIIYFLENKIEKIVV
jgi:hypothetical protein